jgi:hypothetical protein
MSVTERNAIITMIREGSKAGINEKNALSIELISVLE